MPSNSLLSWRTAAAKALDEIAAAQRGTTGLKSAGRSSKQQIIQAYAVLISSHFQGYCRDLHSEVADSFVQGIPSNVRNTVRAVLTQNRKLDKGNPNPGNIGDDFSRFGIPFWDSVKNQDPRNRGCQDGLEELNIWRNAIAHQDFRLPGRRFLRFELVRGWRLACNRLANAFDEVMRSHLQSVNGITPW